MFLIPAYLTSSEIIKLALSTGLFTGIITTIGSILLSIISNRNTIKLEEKKNLLAKQNERIKLLSQSLDKLVSIQKVEVNIKTEKEQIETVKAITSQYDNVRGIATAALPFMDSDLAIEVEQYYGECDKLRGKLALQLYGQTHENDGQLFNTLLTKESGFYDFLAERVQFQIQRLVMN